VERLVARPVSEEALDLGESCRWDETTGRLNWVDVFTGRLFEAEYDGSGLTHLVERSVDGVLTAVAPLPDRSGWVIAANHGIALLSRTGELTPLAEPEAGSGGLVRMNDAVCDPAGRFWAGSMAFDASPGAGSLYRYDLDGSCSRVLREVTISNGIGWSRDGRRMYHVDSGGAGTVTAYDYDVADGSLSGGEPFVVLEGEPGVPDGLCMDSEDHLWLAIWGAGEVRRYSPDGRLVCVVEVAARQPSSCALGGADGRQLFITTARNGLDADVLAGQPDSGRLFCVEVDVPGVPVHPFRGPTGR
jgi:sugar lactone lactonase YvrE